MVRGDHSGDSAYAEAWISAYEPVIRRMTNDEKDRHLAAAAVHGEAPHPQSFLIEISREEPALVITKLEQQAADRGRSLPQLLDILGATVPEFVALVSSKALGE